MKENAENKMKGILQAYKKPQEIQEEKEVPTAPTAAPTDADAPQAGQDTADSANSPQGLLQEIKDAELRAALIRKQCERRGRPKKTAEQRVDPETWQRTTLVIDKDLMDKFREISFRETITLKELVNSALARAIEVYEAKNGKVVPKEHKVNVEDIFAL